MKKIAIILSFLCVLVLSACKVKRDMPLEVVKVGLEETFTLGLDNPKRKYTIENKNIVSHVGDGVFLAEDYGNTVIKTKIGTATYETKVFVDIKVKMPRVVSLNSKHQLGIIGFYSITDYTVETNDYLMFDGQKISAVKIGKGLVKITHKETNTVLSYVVDIIKAFPLLELGQDYTAVGNSNAIAFLNRDDFVDPEKELTISHDKKLRMTDFLTFTASMPGSYTVKIGMKKAPNYEKEFTLVFKEKEASELSVDLPKGYVMLNPQAEELLSFDFKLDSSKPVYEQLRFSVSDDKIARVSENGKVLATGETGYTYVLIKSRTNDKLYNKILVEVKGEKKPKNYRETVVNVALKEVGTLGYYRPNASDPYSKYNLWYGWEDGHWCAMFVSWVMNEAGVSGRYFRQFSNCDEGALYFGKGVPGGGSFNLWRERKDYTPLPGDMIFFDWELDGNLNHVGIVEKVEGGYVYTIEGNSGNQVKRNQYKIDSDKIIGYAILKTE